MRTFRTENSGGLKVGPPVKNDTQITKMGGKKNGDCNYHYMCQGLNSHYFHIIGDGHQPNSRGLYTHYKDSVIKGGRSSIPNIATGLTMAHIVSWVKFHINQLKLKG